MMLGIERALASFDFEHHRFGAARAILQVLDRIRGHQLALVDDDHLLAGLLHFGQNVGAENNGVIAGQAANQLAGFVDLFGIQAGGGLVENQNIGIVDDGLGQSDALPVAFGELADQLVSRRRRWRSARKLRPRECARLGAATCPSVCRRK